jgi:hypothetical protein
MKRILLLLRLIRCRDAETDNVRRLRLNLLIKGLACSIK